MIILTKDRMIELLKEAVAIVEAAGFGGHDYERDHHKYGIAAFEIVLKQLLDDAITDREA